MEAMKKFKLLLRLFLSISFESYDPFPLIGRISKRVYFCQVYPFDNSSIQLEQWLKIQAEEEASTGRYLNNLSQSPHTFSFGQKPRHFTSYYQFILLE